MPRKGTAAAAARKSARAKQTGTPGKAYGNRTDLSQADAQAVRTPPGLPYGQGKKLADMQRAQPLPELSPVPTSPAGAGTSAPSVGTGEDPAVVAAMGVEPPTPTLFAPTNRPDEPITTGLPMGPGAGPEILGPPRGTYVAETFDRLAAISGDPELGRLAEIARAQGV